MTTKKKTTMMEKKKRTRRKKRRRKRIVTVMRKMNLQMRRKSTRCACCYRPFRVYGRKQRLQQVQYCTPRYVTNDHVYTPSDTRSYLCYYCYLPLLVQILFCCCFYCCFLHNRDRGRRGGTSQQQQQPSPPTTTRSLPMATLVSIHS